MSGQKNSFVILGFVVSVSLMASAVTAMLVFSHCSRRSYDLLNEICKEAAIQEPETKQAISAALKEYTDGNSDGAAIEDVLSEWGYHRADFKDSAFRQNWLFAAIGFLSGTLLFLFTFVCRNRMEARRIRALAEYLEQVNIGKAVILSA